MKSLLFLILVWTAKQTCIISGDYAFVWMREAKRFNASKEIFRNMVRRVRRVADDK